MNNLECRILKLERLLFEGKSVGTLYHVCTAEAFAKYIVPTNTLQGSGKYMNNLLGTDDIVSFTRNKNFVVGTDTVQNATVLFQFVVDGDKLSDRYKITPYDDYYSYSGISAPELLEAEEVVEGTIKNFKSYIKEVNFDLTDNLFDRGYLGIADINSLINNIKDIRKYLSGIKVTRSNLPFADFKKKKYNYTFKTLDDVIEFLENIKTTTDDDDYSLKAQSDNQNGSDVNKLIFAQDLPTVKKALKLGANVNQKSEVNELPLEKAIRFNNIKLAKFLIANGATYNHNMIDKLVSRIANIYDDNFADTLMFLIDDLGADIRDNEKASQEYIKICYQQGRNADVINYIKSLNGLTIQAQLFLFFMKDLNIVKLFVKADADPLAYGRDFGVTPLNQSIVYPKTFEYIVTHSNIKQSTLSALLFTLVMNDQFECFNTALKNGADPNYKTYDDQSILNFVIFTNNGTEHKYIAKLIKAGVNVNLKSYGNLPICDAAERPDYYNIKVTLKIVDQLIKAGADPSKVDLNKVSVAEVKKLIEQKLN